jgi:hypothetical protein
MINERTPEINLLLMISIKKNIDKRLFCELIYNTR